MKRLMILLPRDDWRLANNFQKRVWQVNKLAEYGLSVEQIAEVLLIAPATVKEFKRRNISNCQVVEGAEVAR
jgi:DNA-binding NarL/FixJ family response regulator